MTEPQYQAMMAALEQINNRLTNIEAGQENLQEQLQESVERFEVAVQDLMAERQEL